MLADLDGKVFFVVGTRGAGGGTVLLPKLRKSDDRHATIRAAMRRAGEGWGGGRAGLCHRQMLHSAAGQSPADPGIGAAPNRPPVAYRIKIPTLEPASSLPPTAIGDPVSAEPAVPSDNGPPERTGAGQQHEAGIGQGNAIVKLAHQPASCSTASLTLTANTWRQHDFQNGL